MLPVLTFIEVRDLDVLGMNVDLFSSESCIVTLSDGAYLFLYPAGKPGYKGCYLLAASEASLECFY
jgi:hypothetical protein